MSRLTVSIALLFSIVIGGIFANVAIDIVQTTTEQVNLNKCEVEMRHADGEPYLWDCNDRYDNNKDEKGR